MDILQNKIGQIEESNEKTELSQNGATGVGTTSAAEAADKAQDLASGLDSPIQNGDQPD